MEVERSVQHIHLDYRALLNLVVKAFPHCKKLDAWEVLTGGALNTTYKFQIEDKFFVLRIYARDRLHCKIEKAIHQRIDKQVSTPMLIYAKKPYDC